MPATAASAAPMTKVSEMVRSTLTPSSAAIFMSCSQARCARPSGVRDDQPGEDPPSARGREHDDDLQVGELDDETVRAFDAA